MTRISCPRALSRTCAPARVAAVAKPEVDFDRAERNRLEKADAFAELVSINAKMQDPAEPVKVRFQHRRVRTWAGHVHAASSCRHNAYVQRSHQDSCDRTLDGIARPGGVADEP